ncbi:tetratricopeptide repeat protein, partial [bacterium]|nr:tetratricopeptide repeat protein [bacterium]
RRQTTDSLLYARASFLLAQVLSEQSHYGKAHKILRTLYDNPGVGTPVQAEAHLREGILYLKEKKVREAKRQFALVARNTESSLLRQEARVALAQLFAEEGSWMKSDSLTVLIAGESSSYGRDERVLILQARLALQREEPDSAIAILQASQGKKALKFLARAYESSGQTLLAVQVYKKIHDRFSGTPEAEKALFEAGNVFMKTEDWLAARGQFSRLMQEFPESRYEYPIHFRMGWISQELRQFDEAITAFRSGSNSEYGQYFILMEAEALRKQGAEQPDKFREAIAKYNDMIAIASETSLAPVAKLKAAITALQQGHSKDAVASLRQFLSLYPKHEYAPDATFLLATHQESSAKNKYLKEILQKYPNSELFHAVLAALQTDDYQKGHFQAVINRKANFKPKNTTTEPNHWQRLHHLVVAESAYHLGQYELARKEYTLVSSVENDDLSQKAALGEAWCSLQMEEIETAKTAFNQLRYDLIGENRVRAAYGLATALLRNREYEKAITTYPVKPAGDESSDLALLHGKSLYRIGESYFRLEDYGSAIESWDQVVREYPNSEMAPQALFKIGETYFHANHWDSAIAAFQRFTEENPAHQLAAVALLRSAQSHFNASDYQQAILGFETFLQQYPGHDRNREALEGIQLAYYQLGESEQAIEALQKLVEHSPDAALSADARFRIAKHHLETGNHSQAVIEFKEVLTRYPGSSFARDAQLALARAYHADEDYESANAEFLRFIQYFPESPGLPDALFHLGVG